MMTPAYAPTATERVLPRMALDFTTATLDPRVTVTRALNTATRINSSGVIEIVNADLPRFNYANGVCMGLLIEEARTNLLVNSVFSGGVAGSPGTPPTNWLNSQVTGSISAIAPSTYAAGNAFTFTCSTTRRSIYQRVSVAANTSYTASFDMVATTSNILVFNVVDFRNMPAGSVITGFTLNGVAVVGTAVIPAGTHIITATAAIAGTAGTADLFIGLGIQNNNISSVVISNVQLEAGAFPTSYIPTTTTNLTRNADVANMTGANFSDWYNAGAGAWYIQTNARDAATILTAGTFTLTATATALKKYAKSYTSNQSATSLVLGQGTSAKVAYYKQALLAAELAALTN